MVRRAPLSDLIVVSIKPNKERIGFEVLVETFIRKQLRLKAHTVTKVVVPGDAMIVHIDRLGSRLLRCGVCRQRCREVHDIGVTWTEFCHGRRYAFPTVPWRE